MVIMGSQELNARSERTDNRWQNVLDTGEWILPGWSPTPTHRKITCHVSSRTFLA